MNAMPLEIPKESNALHQPGGEIYKEDGIIGLTGFVISNCSVLRNLG